MSAFTDALEKAGLMLPSGADGVVAWSGTFQAVIDGLNALFDAEAVGLGAEVMRLPPVMSRKHFETSGYMKGFPQLAGTVHCFCGTEADHRTLLRCLSGGEDWTGQQSASDVVLTPAACYPVYPILARRGALAAGGAYIDIFSWCYRQEPSLDPARMRSFRVREFIRAGSAADIKAFRAHWMERGLAIAAMLGLQATMDVANDPFFGRPGALRAGMQREEQGKFELLIPIDSEKPNACASFNDHKDLFGTLFGLTQADGSLAQTGCVGFGLERIALALLRRHGLDPGAWPGPVQDALGL